MPAANPVKFPELWNAPPLILNVKPVPPVAVAVIVPLFCPTEASVFVVETAIVTPSQGSVMFILASTVSVHPQEFLQQ